MMGKSWGGFNALQIAALRPPALKAVITVCSTDDRYADDAHYMGGCLLNDNFGWGAAFFSHRARCRPTRRWSATPGARCGSSGSEAVHPHTATWLAHQRRDAYWKHGSVCEDFAAIDCAVYAIGGWADGYTQRRSRVCSRVSPSPRKGLVGPWGHLYPHDGVPGPGDRLSAGMPALVGSLAQGARHGGDGGADVPRLDAGRRSARAVLRGAARKMGGGGGMAEPAHTDGSDAVRSRTARR